MNQLRHEVTMLVNGESRRVMVDEPQAETARETNETREPAAAKPAAKKAAAKNPSLLERAKAAVTGKGKKT